nr:MAG TPA: hypothetical protein [Caudoviricetes sp.]
MRQIHVTGNGNLSLRNYVALTTAVRSILSLDNIDLFRRNIGGVLNRNKTRLLSNQAIAKNILQNVYVKGRNKGAGNGCRIVRPDSADSNAAPNLNLIVACIMRKLKTVLSDITQLLKSCVQNGSRISRGYGTQRGNLNTAGNANRLSNIGSVESHNLISKHSNTKF